MNIYVNETFHENGILSATAAYTPVATFRLHYKVKYLIYVLNAQDANVAKGLPPHTKGFQSPNGSHYHLSAKPCSVGTTGRVIAVSSWFHSLTFLTLALFFSLMRSCWFLLLNFYCIGCVTERTWIGDCICQGPILVGNLRLGSIHDACLSIYSMFLNFLHSQAFHLHHATTNCLEMCF